jgi:gluconokinase
MLDTKPRAVILMGVAGSGKTTVGANLAKQLGWTFLDADDFHPAANVEKMSTRSTTKTGCRGFVVCMTS